MVFAQADINVRLTKIVKVKAVNQKQDESDERYKDAWKIADKIEVIIKTSLINVIATLISQNTTTVAVFFPVVFFSKCDIFNEISGITWKSPRTLGLERFGCPAMR